MPSSRARAMSNHYFGLNIGERDSRYWLKECERFITWFFDVDKGGRNSSQVYSFWQQNSREHGVV